MVVQVFVSHTQKDVEFCDIFDRACARVGIKAFRSEFEKIQFPAWETIRNAIRASRVLFLLIGKELIKAQRSGDPSWAHTQNWIAYEIGIACQRGIDVWVICDDVGINFPVPYLNNYLPLSLRHKSAFDYFLTVLKKYAEGVKTTFPKPLCAIECPYLTDCKGAYNLHMRIKAGGRKVCPQCLRQIWFPKGFPKGSPRIPKS